MCDNNCNQGSGAYCSMKGTWTPCCGNLQETRWAPYETYQGPNGCITGYEKGCGCGGDGKPCNKYNCNNVENYYHTLTSEWKTATNVTPANHDFRYDARFWEKKNNKEGFEYCCNSSPMDYSSLKGAWGAQPKYKSG